MCEHLQPLDNELKSLGVKETFRGQAWSDNCREWVYYDCVLDLEKLKARYNFPASVGIHINDDQRSGTEAGFVCNQCHDAIMGVNPDFTFGKVIVI